MYKYIYVWLAKTMSGHALQEQLKKAHEELRTWREARDRAVAQLGLIHNLVNQLETLHKCRAGHHLLGVVAQHPLCVQLLEVKLIQAVERAYTRAMKEKYEELLHYYLY